MSPSGQAETDFSNLALGGILWDANGHSLALINEKEVKVGDVVGDYRVKAIQRDAVMLDKDGESLVLRITFDEQTAPTPAKGAPTQPKKVKGKGR